MDEQMTEHWEIQKVVGNKSEIYEDTVAIEYPLTISLNSEEFATMLCSPTDVEELVIGFLAGEGVIRTINDIDTMTVNVSQGFVYVQLREKLKVNQKDYSKRFIGSCCGKSRQFYFQNDVKTARTIMSKFSITSEQCYSLLEKLKTQSETFHITGGVHNAALASVEALLMIRSDIGRHNALDKLFGYSIKNNMHLNDKIIVFSGRVSSEVLLKVAKMGVGLLLSKSAPTDLALKLAKDLGITIVGFIRGEEMNIYTHSHRVIINLNDPE